MAKSRLKLVTPNTVKRTVTPKRRRNGDLRTREYLTEAEVERLMKAATGNRHGHRDATMILVTYRHGLRVSELVDLRWDQVDFRTATLHVRRAKQGTPSAHPIVGDELHPLQKITDFAPYVAKIKASGADSVITGNWAQDFALLLKAAADAGLRVNWYTYNAYQTGGATAIKQANLNNQVFQVSVGFANSEDASAQLLKRRFDQNTA